MYSPYGLYGAFGVLPSEPLCNQSSVNFRMEPGDRILKWILIIEYFRLNIEYLWNAVNL